MKKVGFIVIIFIILCGMVSCSTKPLENNQVKINNVVVMIGKTTIDDFIKEGFTVQIRDSILNSQTRDVDTILTSTDNFVDLYLSKDSYTVNVIQTATTETIREMTIRSFHWVTRESEDTDFIQIGTFKIYANDDFEEITKKIERLNPTMQKVNESSIYFAFQEGELYHTIDKNILTGEFTGYKIAQVDLP